MTDSRHDEQQPTSHPNLEDLGIEQDRNGEPPAVSDDSATLPSPFDPPAVASWVSDPWGTGGKRYWDGAEWTGHLASVSAQTHERHRLSADAWAVIAGVAVVVALLACLLILALYMFAYALAQGAGGL